MAYAEETLGLSVTQASHMACGQSECQACILKPRNCPQCLALKKGCRSASFPTRVPGTCGPCLCEVNTSPAIRLSQQTQADSGLAHGQPTCSEAVSHV